MATANVKYTVQSESYTSSIVPRIYDCLKRGTYGDCTLAVEGKVILAHKLILAGCSEYFENIFKTCNHEKPFIILSGIKFIDLCYVLDFAYLGQAKVPQDRIHAFFKAGEILQIRGMKEGWIQFMQSDAKPADFPTTGKSVFDVSNLNKQEAPAEQSAKRPREKSEPSGLLGSQEGSKKEKIASEVAAEEIQVKPTAAESHQSQPVPFPKPFPPQRHRKSVVSSVSPGRKEKSTMESPKLNCRFCHKALSLVYVKKHQVECNNNPDREIATCDVCQMEIKPSSLSRHMVRLHGHQMVQKPSVSSGTTATSAAKREPQMTDQR